jgi:peroxiredoxin
MTETEKPLAAGSPAPDFTLSSGTGEVITLSRQLEHGPVVLYFVREFS